MQYCIIQEKTAVIFDIQEQIIATRLWKKGIGEVDIFRLCGKHKETLQHLLLGWKKLAATV